jgi:DNA-binding NtrC family response regulator
MLIRNKMERLIDEMLDGRILLGESLALFEKIYIEKALNRFGTHVSKTAAALGIHRNTLSKRISLNGNGDRKKHTKRTPVKKMSAGKATAKRKR